jgi:hypothetical protein
MDKDGYGYNLFLVPLPHTADYKIEMFQPMVDGTQWLGYYAVKKGKK